MTTTVGGARIPDSKLAREITELVRDTESPLLFHHSSRVCYFGALAGKHRGLSFDTELLYSRAMSHDMGLTSMHSSAHEAHPRSKRFKEDIIQAFYDGIKRKPETTFGNVKADVMRLILSPRPWSARANTQEQQ